MNLHAPPAGDDLSGLTGRAAAFAALLRFEDLPANVVQLSSRCLVDDLGVMLAGSEQPGMAPFDALLTAEGGETQARMLGASRRLPATRAALWAGTAGHAMDWDDTQLAEGPATHRHRARPDDRGPRVGPHPFPARGPHDRRPPLRARHRRELSRQPETR